MRTSATGAVLVLMLALLGSQSTSRDARPLAITGGTVLDVRTGEEIRDAVVIIDGHRIARVGRRSTVRVPPQARIVDARGRWLLPGLFDMHVHGTARPDVPLELYLANGVTSVRDLGGGMTALRLTREELRAGGREGPRLFVAGAILDGHPPAVPAASIIVDTPERAVSAVDFLVDQGADTLKVYNGVTEAVLEAIIVTAHRRARPVAGHVPRSVTAVRAAELGLDVIEHSPIRSADLVAWRIFGPKDAAKVAASTSVTEREALVWQRVDLAGPDVRALIARLSASGVFLDPTLSIDEYDTMFLYDAEASHPNNRYLPRTLVEEALGPEHDVLRVPAALQSVAREGVAKRRLFIGMCHRAGIPIIAGTDGPGIGTLAPGFGLHHELALLVQVGLSPLEAIRGATLHAARALRQETLLGTIEEGKLADLVIVDADPRATIQNTTRITAVVQDGRLFDRAMLDALLQRVEERQRRSP